MSSADLIAQIYQKLCKKRALRTQATCTCEHVTLLQLFHVGTLSIHWYIAQNSQPTFSLSVLFRRPFNTAIFNRFLKVTIATSNFLKVFHNDGFWPEFSVSMLKKPSRQFEITYLNLGNKKQNQQKNIYEIER